MSYFSVGVFQAEDTNEACSERNVLCVRLGGRVYEIFTISSKSIPMSEWLAKYG
jgi:hypothetical protein